MNKPRANITNDGRGLEKQLENLFALYQRSGLAKIEKVCPPVRRFFDKKLNRQNVVSIENPFLDFIGSINVGGVAIPIHIEAKSSKGKTLKINTVKSGTWGAGGVSKNQVDSMREWVSANNLVILIWHCANTGMYYLFSGEHIIKSVDEGRDRISINDYQRVIINPVVIIAAIKEIYWDASKERAR